MLNRRQFAASAAIGLAAPFVLRGTARAADVTLKLHHLLPPQANVPTNFLTPWAAEIAEASDGRIEIQIFPAMQLGGTPPQLYDQARDGVVDIVWTLARLHARPLPAAGGVRPALRRRRARGVVNSQAIQEFADKHAAEEFPDTQPLVRLGAGPRRHPCQEADPDDGGSGGHEDPLARRGSAARRSKALGATGVSMPVPQVPEALSQGVIDGCVVPWEVVPAIKVHELTGFHTEIPGTPTLYTTAFLLVMNKASYDGLPDDLKQVVMDKSGQYGAKMAGAAFDNQNEPREGDGHRARQHHLHADRGGEGALDRGDRAGDRHMAGGGEDRRPRRRGAA